MKLNFSFFVFVVLAPITLAAILVSVALVWRWRGTARGRALLVLLFSGLGWMVADVLQFIMIDEARTVFFVRISYIFIILTPVAFWNFCVVYTGILRWYYSYFYVFLIIPVINIILVWTNPYHSLFWTSREFIRIYEFLTVFQHGYGVFFFVHILYSYFLVFGGIVVTVYFLYSGPELFRKQLNPFLFGVALVVGYNILQVLQVSPDAKDLSAIFMSFPGIAMVYSILRYQLLEIQPVARDSLIDHLQDGVIILDDNDRILDMNHSAKQIFGLKLREQPVGDMIESYFPEYLKLFGFEKEEDKRTVKWVKNSMAGNSHFDISLEWLQNGKLLTFHNTTETEELLVQVQRLAAIDPLTGIHNRREFFAQADTLLDFANLHRRPLTVMLADLDHFKEHNDLFGHQFGDEILVIFAKFCVEQLREVDLIGRYGGDEFVMILPETNIEQAAKLARRMNWGIKDYMLNECGENCAISISLGLVEYSEMGNRVSLDELIHRADQALYQAKQQGRDCYVVWDERFDDFDYLG